MMKGVKILCTVLNFLAFSAANLCTAVLLYYGSNSIDRNNTVIIILILITKVSHLDARRTRLSKFLGPKNTKNILKYRQIMVTKKTKKCQKLAITSSRGF